MRKRKFTYSVNVEFNRTFLARFSVVATPTEASVDAALPVAAVPRDATLVALLMCAHTAADDLFVKSAIEAVLEKATGDGPVRFVEDSGVLKSDGSAAAQEDTSDVPF